MNGASCLIYWIYCWLLVSKTQKSQNSIDQTWGRTSIQKGYAPDSMHIAFNFFKRWFSERFIGGLLALKSRKRLDTPGLWGIYLGFCAPFSAFKALPEVTVREHIWKYTFFDKTNPFQHGNEVWTEWMWRFPWGIFSRGCSTWSWRAGARLWWNLHGRETFFLWWTRNISSFLVSIWRFPKIRVPQNRWFMMENPMESDDLGVPPF